MTKGGSEDLFPGTPIFFFPKIIPRVEKFHCARDSSILSWFYIDISEKIPYYGLFESKGGTREAPGLSLPAEDHGMAVNP